MIKNLKLSQSSIVILFYGFLLFLRLLWVYAQPLEKLIAFVPDDAFYYLQISKNSARNLGWTFDGLEPTTGFHLLYALLLECIFKAFPEISFHSIFLLVGILGSILLLCAFALTVISISKLFGNKYVWVALIVFTPLNVIFQSTAMMESSLVLFFASVVLYLLISENLMVEERYSSLTFFPWTALVIGFFGSLARSDFGLLPGSLLVGLFLLKFFGLNLKIRGLLATLIGSCLGLVVLFIHNFSISGSIFQSSAKMKSYWNSLFGNNFRGPLNMFLDLILPFWSEVTFLPKIVLMLSLISALAAILIKAKRGKVILSLSLGMLFPATSYIIFYSFNSQSFQIWYVAIFASIAALLLAGLLSALNLPTWMLMSLVIILVPLNLKQSYDARAPYALQADLYEAAQFVKNSPSNNLYGSWNAGILGYFSDNRVVNIDGLANDKILDYVKKGDLFGYLSQRKITHLIDFRAMYASPDLQKRGGFTQTQVDNCLILDRRFAGQERDGWGYIEINRVQHGSRCKS